MKSVFNIESATVVVFDQAKYEENITMNTFPDGHEGNGHNGLGSDYKPSDEEVER